MTTQTPTRLSKTAHDRPEPETSPGRQLDGDQSGKLTTVVLAGVVVGAVVAAAMAIALAIAGGDARSVSDGSWERAELRRMMSLDQPLVDTSGDVAERQRQLRQATGGRVGDGSFETAEEARHNRLNPTDDGSFETAEEARHNRLNPTSDNSAEVAEFQRMTRLRR